MSHHENVPSDWYSNRYHWHCDLCGRTYHAADGRCSCFDDLDDCACGRNQWTRRTGVFIVDDGAPIVCACCGTEPGTPPVDDPEDEDVGQPVKTICALCQTVLRDGIEPASHCICPACERRFDPDA
jgi:hypothetical protein